MPDDGITDSVLPWSRFDTQKSYWELNKVKFKQTKSFSNNFSPSLQSVQRGDGRVIDRADQWCRTAADCRSHLRSLFLCSTSERTKNGRDSLKNTHRVSQMWGGDFLLCALWTQRARYMTEHAHFNVRFYWTNKITHTLVLLNSVRFNFFIF